MCVIILSMLMYIFSLGNTIQSFSISNMVSEPGSILGPVGYGPTTLHLPPVAPVSVAAAAAAVSSLPSLALWHSRLGHASSSRVQQLASRGLFGSVSKDNFDCTSYQLGKQPALSFNNNESISNSIFELIHSDI